MTNPKKLGRPPLNDVAMPTVHIRYSENTMRAAKELARRQFYGNLSAALRHLTEVGARVLQLGEAA